MIAGFAANRNRNTDIVSPNPRVAFTASDSWHCCDTSTASVCCVCVKGSFCCICSTGVFAAFSAGLLCCVCNIQAAGAAFIALLQYQHLSVGGLGLGVAGCYL